MCLIHRVWLHIRSDLEFLAQRLDALGVTAYWHHDNVKLGHFIFQRRIHPHACRNQQCRMLVVSCLPSRRAIVQKAQVSRSAEVVVSGWLNSMSS